MAENGYTRRRFGEQPEVHDFLAALAQCLTEREILPRQAHHN